MLPEFPHAREAIQKLWNRLLFRSFGFSDPLVSQIPVRIQREGDRAFMGEEETKYETRSVELSCKTEIGKGISTGEFFNMPTNAGQQLASKSAADVFDAATQEKGKRFGEIEVDEPINLETWFKKMECLDIDFDKDGTPLWPQFFLTPEATLKLQAALQFWTPEEIERLKQLVEKKRADYNERETRRRLVD